MAAAVEAVDSRRDTEQRRHPRFARVALAAAFLAWRVARQRRQHPRGVTMRTMSGRLDRGNRIDRIKRLDTTAPALPLGWKETARRALADFSRHRVTTEAAAVTFYSILAIFPAVAALVSLSGLFADPATLGAQLDSMSGILPGGAIDVVRDQVTRVAQQGHAKLGLGLAIGVIISLWSANGGTKSLFDALNIVYGVREERGIVKLNITSLAITLGGIAFMLIAAAAVIVLPGALGFAGLSSFADKAVRIVRWPALFLVVAIGLALIYRYGPNRREVAWRWITAGSAFAAIGWLVASLAFSWYAANFGSYNATYGSLGAIIGFMMWIWLSAIVILAGAELDATIEAGRARRPSAARDR
jgi:membrane protein